VSALEQLPHSNKSSTQWYRHSSSHSSVRRRTRLKDLRDIPIRIDSRRVSYHGDKPTDLCPTARWTNLPLCSNNKSQIFSDSGLLRLRRSQRQTLHGKIGLWWLWGRKWLIHRQLTRMEIDSRGRQ
jgi:hypothetical protein